MPDKPTNGGAERSEDDILAKAPLRVLLGGKRYEINPLPILEQRKWRAYFFSLFEDVTRTFAAPAQPRGLLARLWPRDDTTAFVKALRVALLGFPEKLADAFFAYAKELPREEIERTATEQELVAAFLRVWEVAFPFLPVLRQALLASKLATSLSEKSTS